MVITTITRIWFQLNCMDKIIILKNKMNISKNKNKTFIPRSTRYNHSLEWKQKISFEVLQNYFTNADFVQFLTLSAFQYIVKTLKRKQGSKIKEELYGRSQLCDRCQNGQFFILSEMIEHNTIYNFWLRLQNWLHFLKKNVANSQVTKSVTFYLFLFFLYILMQP